MDHIYPHPPIKDNLFSWGLCIKRQYQIECGISNNGAAELKILDFVEQEITIDCWKNVRHNDWE